VKLAQPNNEAIRAAQTSPMPDRVSDDLAGGSPPQLIADLEDALGEGRVLSTALDLVRYATDASPYRMVPAAVVIARDTSDISNALRFARRAGRSAVFRAGGTSLSGQAQTDDLLVDVRKHWYGIHVLDERALQVRVRPGTTVGQVNATLQPYGRVLGPDPASSNVACVGGVVSNNASGMTAGTTHART
jgi:D-lactate dehydrogenase